MLKADIERMTHFYYRKSRVLPSTFEDFKKIEEEGNVQKIFEIYEEGYIGKWYYILLKKGKSIGLDYGLNNPKLANLMQMYMDKYNGKKLNVEEIKMFRKGFFPAIHKVDADYFYRYCDPVKKTNTSDYRYLYTETSDGFIGIGDYNNKYYVAKFYGEEDTIKSLLDLHIMSQNVEKEDLYKYVIDSREEKDFEMIL